MLEFERRVENWLVEVMCMVLDILAFGSGTMLGMFEDLDGGVQA
jgi:hypothetical protein